MDQKFARNVMPLRAIVYFEHDMALAILRIQWGALHPRAE
jgi:hypothetical protein